MCVARNGRDALQMLQRDAAPDVILLDLMMPVMDGWQFRVEQKRDPLLAQIPVIAMSANMTSQAQAIDAAAFAPKPLRVDELRQTIDRVISDVRATRDERRDGLASLGTLTAAVAHEISNPLTYVFASLDQLARELPAAVPTPAGHLPALVSDALDGTRRITEIVRNIQTLAHVARDRTTKAVDLRSCVEQSLEVVRQEAQQRAEVRLRLEPVPPVRANAARVERVITNLLTNAFRAVGDRQSDRHVIAVATKAVPSAGRVRVEISDTGPTVPAHLSEQIFEPFFTSRFGGSGTALGLAVCRTVIQDAGGDIGVLTPAEGGALFWFELPAFDAQHAPSKIPAAARPERRFTFVAIDRDPTMLGALERIIGRAGRVFLARDMDGGLALAARHRADVILLDAMLPGSTVEHSVGRFRAAFPELARRVVLMTGGPLTETDQSAVNRASLPVLTKPFRLEELLDATWSLSRSS